MKILFEIYIQKDLTDEEKSKAKEFCQYFIDSTLSDSKKRYFGVVGGGYTSGLWRGRLGLALFYGQPGAKKWDENLVFRRISKNKRKFAVVRIDTLEVYNDKYLDKSHYKYRDLLPNGPIPNTHCYCPRHKGSIKVRFKQIPELELFESVKDI